MFSILMNTMLNIIYSDNIEGTEGPILGQILVVLMHVNSRPCIRDQGRIQDFGKGGVRVTVKY